LTTGSFPHDNFSSVYWIFTKHGHMIPVWKGKNPIYFGVITIIPFDNLYRRAYFVMHTFLVPYNFIYMFSKQTNTFFFLTQMYHKFQLHLHHTFLYIKSIHKLTSIKLILTRTQQGTIYNQFWLIQNSVMEVNSYNYFQNNRGQVVN